MRNMHKLRESDLDVNVCLKMQLLNYTNYAFANISLAECTRNFKRVFCLDLITLQRCWSISRSNAARRFTTKSCTGKFVDSHAIIRSRCLIDNQCTLSTHAAFCSSVPSLPSRLGWWPAYKVKTTCQRFVRTASKATASLSDGINELVNTN